MRRKTNEEIRESWKAQLSEEQRNNLISPLRVLSEEEKKNYKGYKPFYKMENELDGVVRYAISALTDGGKWVRGNTLYYSLNGLNIYTDINNIIFVNKEDNSIFVREYSKVNKQINTSNPEEKQYILLFTEVGEEESDSSYPFRWEACQGRKDAYEHIKVNAPVIDIDKSIILVEDVSLKDALTVRQFVKHLKNSDMVEDDLFEIDDYYGSDDY